MLKLKFSPLILFIILLVVLIFSTIICKTCFLNNGKESFVSYQKDKDTTVNPNTLFMVDLPQYSKTNPVAKLYDNLFFDKLNGNLIEVDSRNFSTSGNVAGNVDTTGATVTNIYVNTRSNTNRSYPTVFNNGNVVGMDVAESLSNAVTRSFTNWSYVTTSTSTDKYQVFYMPWAESTYMHIIKLKNYQSSNFSPTHIMSFMFGPGGSMSNKYYSLQTAAIRIQNDDNDPSNDKYVYDDYYDTNKSVYQLSKYVKFDRSNGNLIIRSDSGITIYDRNGSVTNSKGQGTSSTMQNNDFNSFIVSDNYKYIVLYLPISTKTMIALLKIDPSDSNRFKIEKVVRFNKDGIETESGTSESSGATQPTLDMNEFYKRYSPNVWNMPMGSNSEYMSEDYLLKTQIVPPVCPSCPSCAYSSGACSNCGGAGGSGTLNGDGKTLVDSNKGKDNVTGTAVVTSGGAVVSGTTGSDKPINNAVSQTTNTLNTTVGTAGVLGGQTLDTTADILKSTGSGATDLLKSAGSGATDLLKSGASGATDLLKSTASGATDLLKSAGSGLKEIATDNRNAANVRSAPGAATGTGAVAVPTAVVGTGISTRGVNGIDNYSYYGALPSKGGNYMPITADFSAFSK